MSERVYFILNRHTSTTRGAVRAQARFMCGELLWSFVMKREHTMQDYQFRAQPGMPVVNDTWCTYSDFVK